MTARGWAARFISPLPVAGRAPASAAPYFRREFSSAGSITRATLHVTALGLVEPYLNGVRIGTEVLAPGWTSYRHRLNYSSYDVTGQLRTGANVVGAIIGAGWARGRIGGERPGRTDNIFADQPGLFMQLEIERSSGTRTIIGTDTSFRASTGPLLSDSIYDGEQYDARLEQTGWCEPGFDDSSWTGVQEIPWDLATLEPPTKEPVRCMEELPVTAILTSPSGKKIIDFGQNLVGWVRLTVKGPPGTTITLRHAEVLSEGELSVRPLRTAEATDSFTLSGTGLETWEPRFTFHGFRYVEVDGYPGDLVPEALTAVVIHTDMRRTGWFESSNPLLNQLHANSVWSMRGNFVSLPTDCPQRDERLGWTGDINIFAPAAAYLFDVRGILRSWLRDLAQEQAETGNVPMVVPNYQPGQGGLPIAVWSDVAVLLPWTLYQAYGDEAILQDAYASMTAYTKQVEHLLNPLGLWDSGFQFGDWLDPDAPPEAPGKGKTEPFLVAQAYFCRVTRVMTETARVLGLPDDEVHFGQLAERVREAFLNEYAAPNGRLTNGSATAYALAIVFDILNDTQRERAGTILAKILAEGRYAIPTGFAGTHVLCDALTRTGHVREAYRLLLRTECPSFLYPVTMGATTIWERWDSLLPDGTVNPGEMTSFNHYAFGAVTDWIHRTVGGLGPAEPGYKRLRIAPQPGGDISSATTKHLTPFGEASVSWRIVGGRSMTLSATVPNNTTAEVILPMHPATESFTAGPGTHEWTYEIGEDFITTTRYTLETTMGDLLKDSDAWERFCETFASYFPHVPIEAITAGTHHLTVTELFSKFPGVPPGFTRSLEHALNPA